MRVLPVCRTALYLETVVMCHNYLRCLEMELRRQRRQRLLLQRRLRQRLRLLIMEPPSAVSFGMQHDSCNL